MTATRTTNTFGWRVYGLGLMAAATVNLVLGDFDPGQPVPKAFPARHVLAYTVAVFLLLAGAAIQWRKTTTWAAAALTVYYTLFVVILMNGRLLLKHYTAYGIYSGAIGEQLAIALGALLIFVSSAPMDPALAKRLTRVAQAIFGVCAILWGGAHFVYMNLTAPIIPKWLPPSQLFWGYTTGICFIAAGLAILTGIKARLAAILLTAMIGTFTLLVHIPMLLANHTSAFNWTELTANLTLFGAAWVVADSLSAPKRL